MTKLRTGPSEREGIGSPEARRCLWCGRPFTPGSAVGRPRRYCRRSCRQRDFEARRRSSELGLSEAELVVTRRALEELEDLRWILARAVEDVDRDLSVDDGPVEVRRCLEWMLEAARPLVAAELRATPGG